MCRKITVNSLLPSISSNCYHRYIFKNNFNSTKSFKQNKKLKHTKFASMIFGTNTNKNDLVFIFRFFLPYCSININYLIRMLCDMDLKISFQFCIYDISSVVFKLISLWYCQCLHIHSCKLFLFIKLSFLSSRHSQRDKDPPHSKSSHICEWGGEVGK